jgi:peptidyl-tRNA hydrolase
MSPDTVTPIASHAEFAGVVRQSFVDAEQAGAREILLADPDFAEWPLNEREVIETLSRWIDSGRALTVLAHSFDELARRQLRFVEWRRQWAHVVFCRHDPELEAGQIPTLLLVPGVTCLRLLDRVRHRGTVSNRPVELTECRQSIDALLQRSVEGFPVTTLGL